jgi:hypothetical protein
MGSISIVLAGIAGVGVRLRRVIAPQSGNFLVEILEGIKRAIDGREPQVSDLVQLAQRPENGAADVIGTDLGTTGGADVFLDSLRQQRERVLIDGTTLACLAYAGDDLLAPERFGGSTALDHQEGGCLERREATTAGAA